MVLNFFIYIFFFQSLVIRKKARLRAPNVALKALDYPKDATRFQIDRSISDSRAARLTLAMGLTESPGYSCSSIAPKTVTAVAVHPERAGVLHGVPIGKARIGEGSGSAIMSHTMGSLISANETLAPFLMRAAIGRIHGHLSQELSVVRNATQERAQLLQVAAHEHVSQSRHFISVWTKDRRRDGVTQEIGVRRAKPGFRGRELEVVLT